MYEQAYKDIGKGLRLVFFGEILVDVAALFSWPVLTLAGLVLTLAGLSTAGRGDSGYRKAFSVTILNLAVTFLGMILAGVSLAFMPVLGGLFTAAVVAASAFFSFLSVYYVCTTSAALLAERETALSMRAENLWKIFGVCIAVTTVCVLVMQLPFMAAMVLTIGVSFIANVVQFAAGVLYMLFLYKASEVFLHW